jgi:hypothetical protein
VQGQVVWVAQGDSLQQAIRGRAERQVELLGGPSGQSAGPDVRHNRRHLGQVFPDDDRPPAPSPRSVGRQQRMG